MFLLTQLLTIIVSIAVAGINAIAVSKMRDFGASIKEEKFFHMMNAGVKIGFALTVAFLLPHFITALVTVLLLQWLVFDIALNLYTEKEWDYIGHTAWIDKKLNRLFPLGDGGQVKALGCLGLIIVTNILYSFFS